MKGGCDGKGSRVKDEEVLAEEHPGVAGDELGQIFRPGAVKRNAEGGLMSRG
jgi:hypothetical protein